MEKISHTQTPVYYYPYPKRPPPTLYFAHIHPSVDEKKLLEIIGGSHQIKPIYLELARPYKPGLSFNSAVVSFRNVAEAETIRLELNNLEIQDCPMRVLVFDPLCAVHNEKAEVVIYHLSPKIKQKELYEKCKEFGEIKDAYIAKEKNVAFVIFTKPESQPKAIAGLNGGSWGAKEGYTLKVVPFAAKEDRTLHRYAEKPFNNLYIKGIPRTLFTEEDLTKLFMPFGTITSFLLRKDPEDPSKNSGVAFLCYKENESAKKAIEALNGTRIFGTFTLVVQRHYKKAELDEYQAIKKAKEKEEVEEKWNDSTLFVRPLPDKLSEADFKQAFAGFGKIISAKIVKKVIKPRVGKPLVKSCGFGFICFSTPEDASKAFQGVYGKPLFGSKTPIEASYARKKETSAQYIKMNYEKMVNYAKEHKLSADEEGKNGTEKAEEEKPQENSASAPSVARADKEEESKGKEEEEEESPYYINKKWFSKIETEESKKAFLQGKLVKIVSEYESDLADKIVEQFMKLPIDDILKLFDGETIEAKINDWKEQNKGK